MRYCILPCIVLLFIGCRSDDAARTAGPQRPYEPWAIRSVLDDYTRILTLALHEDMWAAYHTESGALYKAWKGYVDFEGAVFTTSHGPQPASVGDAYMLNTHLQPWRITRGDEETDTRVQYAGHRFRDHHAELMYDIYTDLPTPIRVYEMVEYRQGSGGLPGLERIFTVENMPDGHGVRLYLNVSSIASLRHIETDGDLVITSEETRSVGGMQVMDIDGYLDLKNEGATRLTIWFVSRPVIRNLRRPTEVEDEGLPLGQRLIARSDCKTCHNPTVQTIGPSYVAIAQRYPNTSESVSMLANKVIRGGAGIWGMQVMSPHPELSETDAAEMVRYILSLDPDEDPAEIVTEAAGELSPPGDVDANALIPGAITTVYQYPQNLRQIPTPSGRPVMAGVMPNFDNISGAMFAGLTDNFALFAEGYLFIPEEGTYILQIWSDDGSRFSLNDRVLIDHDGPHGTASKEVTVHLSKGYYPFLLEYFQGLGDRFLSMNWRRPGATAYEVIPVGNYFHETAQRTVTSGLTLPMSVLARVPGDGFPLEAVHPAYDLSQARPYDFLPRVGGMDFFPDGTLAVCTWDPTGSVYLVRNLDAANPNDIQVKRIASGLAEPLGLKVVDNTIYVLQKQELTRLVDTDGDEIIDEFQTVSNGWETSPNFHEFAFGLEYRDGYFYGNLAIAIEPGGASTQPQIPTRGTVMRIARRDGNVEYVAHGLRTPNGIGWGVDDELFVTDNQGDWLPSSKVVHVREGAFFGSRAVDFEGTKNLREQPPLVWLPQDEIGNSPGTPGLLRDGPYAGHMTHGEVTHGGLKRVFVEHIDGQYQGALFRFTQGLEAGVNRIAWAPDGSIFIGGIGNPGNWGQTGKLWYGLQRLRYNGKPVFEMLKVRAKSNGMEIEFTEPLREGDGWDPSDFEVRQWRYVPTEDYGGPKVDERALQIVSASVSEDRSRVFLELRGMKEDHVVYIRLLERFISAAGRGLWSTECWYTLNRIPASTPGELTRPQAVYAHNTLTAEEEAQGWKLLFDGRSLDGWRNFKSNTIGTSWIVEDGAIALDAQRNPDGHWQAPDGGDIITEDTYENFDLYLEWKISNCGNSGIMFSVVEDDGYNYVWETGPEMQILDNACHPDARYQTHRAGDLYDLIECKYMTVHPAGVWNKVRILKQNGHVEFWLNGVKVVEFEMYTERWQQMIANSKFKDMPGFGQAREGHIALQDHGDKVWFRNIRIREL